MRAKDAVIIFILAKCFLSCFAAAALRRTPKVYNALITTDENLTSSRAYPVIQPTIHETGISHFPFTPYNSFGYYSPAPVVRFGQPLAPGLIQREQLPYPLPQSQFPPQVMQHLPPHLQGLSPFNGYPAAQNTPTGPSRVGEVLNAESVISATEIAQKDAKIEPTMEQQPVVPPRDTPNHPFNPTYMPIEQQTGLREMPKEKLPIQLNEYGLPPSLIPLPQYPISRNGYPSNTNSPHINLPPYAFNQYPILPGFYDPLTGVRQQFLPPYDYSANPQQTYALAAAAAKKNNDKAATNTPIDPQEVETSNPSSDNSDTKQETNTVPIEDPIPPDFDSIKNASKNKNSEVPDVPPPPIPSGAKTKASS